MLKKINIVLVATLAILCFGENVADAAAHLITKVITDPASEPMTLLLLGTGLVLGGHYCRKNIIKK